MEINGIGNIAIPTQQVTDALQKMASQPAQGGNSATSANMVSDSKSMSLSEKTKQEATTEDLQSAIDKVNQFVSAATNELQFSVDNDSHRTVIKVIDRTTNETLTQIPSQEMIELAKALDKLQGLLVKQKA